MAFNLFHPLRMLMDKRPEVINIIAKELFPTLPIYTVESILIEFIPTPISQYTCDKSAMDAAIIFSDNNGFRYLIAIETKYSDSLGQNKAKKNSLKYETAKTSGLFTETGLQHISNGCTQMYRNFLLAEKYRMVNNLQDSYSIILAPKDHPTTDKEISSLLPHLQTFAHYKIKKRTLEDFVTTIKTQVPSEYLAWIDWFHDRYLNFGKLKSISKSVTGD
jgi:hypothetical protein